MFIHAIHINPLSVPLQKPITTHLHTLEKIECLAIVVYTDEGITGHSLIRGLGKTSYQEVKQIIEKELMPQIINSSFIVSEVSWQKFWKINRANKPAAYIYALAALDIALWDIFTKAKNVSLHQYLGSTRPEISVYGTTGWLSLTDNELLEECEKYANQGIKAFKIRIGHPNDYQRVALVRRAMGDEFILMVDANQRYTVQEAIAIANKLEEFDIAWLEEPVGNSVHDLLEVKINSSIPIAVGENITEQVGFSEVCVNKAAAFLQPDIIRCGGITGFQEMAQVIQNYNVPLCNHLLPELSVSLIGAYSNGYMLEYDDLLPADFFTEDFSIKEGYMRVPTAPGTGIELSQETLKRFSI